MQFLVGRKQCVKFKDAMSSMITTNTGAPQGCCSSPILFTLYTSDCRSGYDDVEIIKYAHDTVIIGLMSKQKTFICPRSITLLNGVV